MATSHQARRIRFGPFELDLTASELKRNGKTVALQDKPLELLRVFVERPGEIVTRDALKRRLWASDTHVDFDNNLNAAVKKLRDALGDSAGEPRFIETLPRKGYRFLAVVRGDSVPRSRTKAILVAASLAAAVGIWYGLAAGTKPDRARLVVLPLESSSEHVEDEALASGLTEELTTHLGRLSPERLGVIGRSSAMAVDPKAGADRLKRELDVDYVVEGGLRREGDRLRITVRLVQLSDRTQRWSESYELPVDEILGLHDTLAVDVARSVADVVLGGPVEVRARAGTTRTTAYRAYLRGVHAMRGSSTSSWEDAMSAFERALEIDADYALAHLGLAKTLNSLGRRPRVARQSVERAIELDDTLADAHAVLGFSKLHVDWDVGGAKRALERALELNPDSPEALHTFAAVHAAEGRLDDAIESVKRGLAIDPRSRPLRGDLGWYLLAAGRYAEAFEECRGLLDETPAWAHECLSYVHGAEGRTAEAAIELRSGLESLGVRTKRSSNLTALREARLQALVSADACLVRIAGEYARLGDREQALDWLERAVRARAPGTLLVAVDPSFAELRPDPRFAQLVRTTRGH